MNSKKNKIKQKKIYLGIEILRFFFAFNILLFHCINKNIYSQKLIKKLTETVRIALTTFFIMSFYFSYNSFTSKNIFLIKQRFKRLLIPYIIWPIIIYINNNFFFKKKNIIEIKYLYYQILIANGIYNVFWFNFNLIFISLIIVIIIFLTSRYMIVLILVGIFIYLYSSSIYYNKFFSDYNEIATFTTKPIAGTYVTSLIGFYISSKKIIDKTKKNIKKILLSFLILLILLNIYNNKYKIFLYLFSVYLFILFAILPFDKLINNNIYLYIYILQISSYTGGIYYLHNYINSLLKEFFLLKFTHGTIFVCIINYLICYLICFIGSKILRKGNFKYLFI